VVLSLDNESPPADDLRPIFFRARANPEVRA
jgi:hypothetical protein